MSSPLIGEAAGKVSVAERRHCYQIARGEAMERGAILDVVQLLHEGANAELADENSWWSDSSAC